MARVPERPLLRGTIGSFIFYSVGGKQYVRSKPAKVRQPNTPKQLLARDKFRQSSKLAKALSRACPLLGQDETGNRSKSAYHTILGVLRTSPFREDRDPVRWVWEQMVIRKGGKPQLDMRSHYRRETSTLKLDWQPDGSPKGSTLLVTGIHTETLEVELHRFPAEAGRGEVNAAPGTAWYGHVKTSGWPPRVSGTRFIKLAGAGREH